MTTLEGKIEITGLPPNRGLIVHLGLFEVSEPDAPAPYNGNPPPEAVTDSQKVIEDVHLRDESREPTFKRPFRIEHRPGYYYVQVRVILFRDNKGSMFAHAEQFFFARRPLPLTGDRVGPVTFPVSWPDTPLDQLHHYGTFKPQG
jgi:hypothetical protein